MEFQLKKKVIKIVEKMQSKMKVRKNSSNFNFLYKTLSLSYLFAFD